MIGVHIVTMFNYQSLKLIELAIPPKLSLKIVRVYCYTYIVNC